ncbi:MAG: hypothetical protein AAGF92_21435 [Myxococcota bacterium]
MSSVPTEPPPPPPSPTLRRRTSLFIGLFVALQFIVPLTYLVRDDPADDRFTWRGATHQTNPACETSATMATVDGSERALAPERLIHPKWVAHLERDRDAVVSAFLRKQCETEGALEVTLTNACGDAEGVREYRLRCGADRASVSARRASR